MSYPTPYVVTYNFARDEADLLAGRSTVKTTELDTELANAELTISQILTNLRLIQRSDNALADSIVSVASLAADVITLIGSAGLVPKGAWVTATAYAVKDLVTSSGAVYICVTAHTSGTFATDLAAGKWMVLVAAQSAVVGFVAVGSATPTIAPAAATTDGLAIGSGANATAARSVAIGKARAGGADSTAINVQDATASYGALAAGAVAIGKKAKADGAAAAAVGGDTCTATGVGAATVGGNANTAGGSESAVVGGALHAVNGDRSAAVGGTQNTVDAGRSVVLAGESHTIDSGSSYAAIIAGLTNQILSSAYAVCVGGANLIARRGGQFTFGIRSSATSGGQGGALTACIQTTNATPTVLKIGGAAGTVIAVNPNSTVGFELNVVGRRTDSAGEAAMYTFTGLIANNAGTTAIVGAVAKVVVAESDAAWDAAVTASDAADSLVITVTGAAAKTIEWSALIRLNEVGSV